PGAALYVHNHTDRPIYSYWVNGNWGGNAAAYGGGTTCCWKIVGEQLEIHWIKDRTGAQVEAGLQEEEVTLFLPNPPRQRGDDTLHVHFLPGDQVRLAWSKDRKSTRQNSSHVNISYDAPCSKEKTRSKEPVQPS